MVAVGGKDQINASERERERDTKALLGQPNAMANRLDRLIRLAKVEV